MQFPGKQKAMLTFMTRFSLKEQLFRPTVETAHKQKKSRLL